MVDVEGRLPQHIFAVHQFPDIRSQPFSVVGEHHAPLKPRKQLHPQLVLQPRHDLADARLGIVQCLCRLGKAAGFADLQKDLVAVG